jgi:ssDNA-binding Zn-finger/Zn-ribbon topoisomerase 1
MICKEVDYDRAIQAWSQLLDGGKLKPMQERDARWQRAGLQAERDMAYQLKVFFADRKPFAVFNNVKIEHNGLSAQIDHLVLTRWTAYFIESKSVSQVITVNEHGEWARIHNRRYMPVESPVEQSRRHQETLYNFLWANRDQFQGSFLGLTWNIKRLLTPVHYVAISTHGQIKGRGRRKFPDVKKADQIPAAILAYHESLNTGLLSNSNRDEDMDAFSKKSFAAVTEILLRSDMAATPEQQVQAFMADLPEKSDTPDVGEREATATELTDDADEPVAREYTCRKCESKNIAVTHGRYGYYFKCNDCDGNTPIVELCESCSERMKVSKSGDCFSLACPKCGRTMPLQLSNVTESTADQSHAASEPSAAENASEPACPLCGRKMTLRTARRGNNAGSQFWGCTGYPKCRGIVAKN